MVIHRAEGDSHQFRGVTAWLRAKVTAETFGQTADRAGYAPMPARNQQDRASLIAENSRK